MSLYPSLPLLESLVGFARLMTPDSETSGHRTFHALAFQYIFFSRRFLFFATRIYPCSMLYFFSRALVADLFLLFTRL